MLSDYYIPLVAIFAPDNLLQTEQPFESYIHAISPVPLLFTTTNGNFLSSKSSLKEAVRTFAGRRIALLLSEYLAAIIYFFVATHNVIQCELN